MNISLEYKKIKRTGILWGCLLGGILGACVPILELAVRSGQYMGLMQPPLQTILEADWQMMAMLNMLAVITAACMMYHTEYADHGIRRMTTLPVLEEELFLRKAFLLAGICVIVLVTEMLSLIFCTLHWFGGEGGIYEAIYGGSSAGAYMRFMKELSQNFGYCFCMLVPAILLGLLTASVFRNMWIPLGIDVVCIFMATMIPEKYFGLSLFPFALPFQILEGTASERIVGYLIAALLEVLVIAAAEMLFLKVRRALA